MEPLFQAPFNGLDEDATDTKLFQIVQQLPEYPGGMSALVEFLTKNLQYPSNSARDKCITGKSRRRVYRQ